MDVVINAQQDPAFSVATSLPFHGDFYLNVLAQLGQDPVYPPVADFLRLHHQLAAGDWLIVSPIQWQVTHNDAMIVAYGETLSLTEALSRIWFAEISQFLVHDGFELIYHSPYFWLINATGKPALQSPSLPAMVHQSLMPILAKLDGTMYWQRLFTEIQMFLSSHPLNTDRNRVTPINGLWFWGGGQLLLDVPEVMRPILTDDPVINHVIAGALPINLIDPIMDKNTLVAIYDSLSLGGQTLEKKLVAITQKQTVNWYWNNLAYQTKRVPWYKKLWRK